MIIEITTRCDLAFRARTTADAQSSCCARVVRLHLEQTLYPTAVEACAAYLGVADAVVVGFLTHLF